MIATSVNIRHSPHTGSDKKGKNAGLKKLHLVAKTVANVCSMIFVIKYSICEFIFFLFFGKLYVNTYSVIIKCYKEKSDMRCVHNV